jgi:molecular chaperone GrpE
MSKKAKEMENIDELESEKNVNLDKGNEEEMDVSIVKGQLDEKVKQCEQYYSMLQRSAAEFDNYKKRTAREKEGLYGEALNDIVSAFLPVADNLERALQACNIGADSDTLKDGVCLVIRQLKDVLKNLGVEEIKTVGEIFNPEKHNAVMHIEDDSVGQNIIVEEFQKGYIFKEKVIRYSMVKVAN